MKAQRNYRAENTCSTADIQWETELSETEKNIQSEKSREYIIETNKC